MTDIAKLNLADFRSESLEFEALQPQPNPHSVLILAHGRTGNLKLLQWYAKRFEIPGLGYLAVQAPLADQRADQSDGGFSWYRKNREGLSESRAKLNLLVSDLQAFGVAPSRVFWLGFSQGAAMGLDLALRGPYRMGGFICVSGLCVESESYPASLGPWAKDQRILITHGTRDDIISLEGAEATYLILKESQVPYEFAIFDKPHSFHLNEEVPFIEKTLKTWVAG